MTTKPTGDEGWIRLGYWRGGAPQILLVHGLSLRYQGGDPRPVLLPVDAPAGAWVAWLGSTASPYALLAVRLPMCWYSRVLRGDGELEHEVHGLRPHGSGPEWHTLQRDPPLSTLVTSVLHEDAAPHGLRPAGPAVRGIEAADMLDLIRGLGAVRGSLGQ